MAVEILGRRIPAYDLLLIAIGPVVLVRPVAAAHPHALGRAGAGGHPGCARWWARWASTRPGSLTSVFFVGSVLAGLGGALQIPREPANLDSRLPAVIADAFVITVVGGPGQHRLAPFWPPSSSESPRPSCIGIGTVTWFGFEISFSKLTLVVEFLIMAIVLVARPLRASRQASGGRNALPPIPSRR